MSLCSSGLVLQVVILLALLLMYVCVFAARGLRPLALTAHRCPRWTRKPPRRNEFIFNEEEEVSAKSGDSSKFCFYYLRSPMRSLILKNNRKSRISRLIMIVSNKLGEFVCYASRGWEFINWMKIKNIIYNNNNKPFNYWFGF